MRGKRTAGLDWRYTVMRSLCSCFALPVFLSSLFASFMFGFCVFFCFVVSLVLTRVCSAAELGEPLPPQLETAEYHEKNREEGKFVIAVVGLWG